MVFAKAKVPIILRTCKRLRQKHATLPGNTAATSPRGVPEASAGGDLRADGGADEDPTGVLMNAGWRCGECPLEIKLTPTGDKFYLQWA